MRLFYPITTGSGGGGTGLLTLNGLITDPQTFATVNDTNVTLNISSVGSTHTFTAGWASTLALARGGTGLSTAPANGQLLIGNGTGYALSTLTGTANLITVTNGAGSILLNVGSNVPTSVINDTNVTGSIATNTLTLGWTGNLAIGRGGTGLSSTPSNGQLLIGNGVGYTLSTLTGTANQIIVTNAVGAITLSTPQNINTGASPTFGGLTLSNLTLGSVIFAGAGSVISEDNANLFYSDADNRLQVGSTTTGNLANGFSASYYARNDAATPFFFQGETQGASGGFIGVSRARAANANLVSGDIVGGLIFSSRHNSTTQSIAGVQALYRGDGTTRTGSLHLFTRNAGTFVDGISIGPAGNIGAGADGFVNFSNFYIVSKNSATTFDNDELLTLRRDATTSTEGAKLVLERTRTGFTNVVAGDVVGMIQFAAKTAQSATLTFSTASIKNTYSGNGTNYQSNTVFRVADNQNATTGNIWNVLALVGQAAPSVRFGSNTGFGNGFSTDNNAKLEFANASNTNLITLLSGATTASYTLTLPTAQGGTNSLLTNDGTGILSFVRNSKVFALRSAVQTINTTATTIAFDSEQVDVLNEYIPATGTFTATSAGHYFITATLNWTAAGNNDIFQAWITSTASANPAATEPQASTDNTNNGSTHTLTVSGIFNLAAAGTLRIRALATSSTNLSLGSQLSIQRII